MINDLIEGLRLLSRYAPYVSSTVDEIVVAPEHQIDPDAYADLIAMGWTEHQGEWSFLL